MGVSPTVSVLVTVFNREKYLAECIGSILNSSYNDYEIVIVDDCSTDGSVGIAKAFQAQHGRIRFYQNPVNLGDYANRNRAAELARGEFLKYVDSDDLIKPDCLEKLLQPLLTDSSIAYSISYPRPENTSRPLVLNNKEAYQCHFVDRQGIFSSGPLLAMIRTDRFREMGGFRENVRNMGDTVLWLELSARWSMAVVDNDLTWWRQHEGQESELIRDFNAENATTHCKLSALTLNEFLKAPKCPLAESERSRVRRDICMRNIKRIIWHLVHRRLSIAILEFKWLFGTLAGYAQDVPASNAGNN